MAHALTFFVSSFIDTLYSWKIELLNQWPTITQGLKTTIVIEKIDNDRLVISVSSSAWLQEMHFFSDTLLEKINATLDKPRIRKLQFKYKSKGYKQQIVKACSFEQLNPDNSLSTPQRITLATVQDKELQKYLKLFLIRCKLNENNDLSSASDSVAYKKR